MAAEGVKFKFVFCGLNTDSPEFQNLITAHNLQDYAYCIGTVDHIPSLYQALDLYFFPSLTEGQPNALIEAMLSDLPVITSDIPPIREALPKESEHCLINPNGDASEAASKIQDLINHPQKREKYKFGSWAAEKFDVEKNYQAFFEEIK